MRGRRIVGRQSAQQIRSVVSRLLDRHPDVKTAVVLRLTRRLGYTGGKSAMYALVAEVRAEKQATEAVQASTHPSPAEAPPIEQAAAPEPARGPEAGTMGMASPPPGRLRSDMS